MSYDNWSFSRNGLMTIGFNSNVRELSKDIRRKQINKFRIENNQTDQLVSEEAEPYSVFNSETKFDIDDSLNREELLQVLTVQNIRTILQTFRITYPANALKPQLVQILSNAIQNQPNRINYVRQVHSQHIANVRRARQAGNRNPNGTILISNQHKYSKKDFDGMSLKAILRSLFEFDYHLLFLYERVLKSKEIPISRAKGIASAVKKIRAIFAKNPLYTNENKREVRNKVFQEASIRTDRILKHNSQIVLDILFAPRRPFYINKRLYTVLGYHQENGPTQDPEEGLDMQPNSTFVVYPVIIHLELSDSPPDKVSDADIQKVSCHLRGEKIRKDWHDIWYRPDGDVPPQRLFERNYHKTIKKPMVSNNLQGGGSKKNKKTRRRRKNDMADDVYIAVSGDIMFGRYVGKEYHPLNIKKPFKEVEHIFKPCDLAIVNLETPFFDETPTWWKKYKLPRDNYQKTLVAPTSKVKELVDAGINFVSLANNHADDAGYEGFASTIRTLDSANILHAGVSINGDPFTPKIIKVKHRPIVVFSVTFIRNFGGEWGDVNEYSPPLAYIDSLKKYNHLLDLIKKIRKTMPNAFIIVSVHWGVQYKEEIEEWQENVAQNIVDTGANCILGHHPHVLQKVAMYKGAVIFYSLGNLLFDHNYDISGHASKKNANTQKGAVYTFTVTPSNNIKNLTKVKTVSTPTGIISGGSKNHEKYGGGTSNPAAAAIEYLEYKPLQSQEQVNQFYKNVDNEWGDFESGTNMLNIFSKEKKRVNSIDHVLQAMEQAKETTFCNRQTGDGDCEDTADKVLELIKHNPQGKYTVSSLRFEYNLLEDPYDPDETPEFVQNHGFLAFYDDDSKEWFKTGIVKY